MRSHRLLVTCALAVTALVARASATVAAAAPSAAPYCGITWGSLSKTSGPMTSAPVTDARAGRHDCYDRLVVDLANTPAPGFQVAYTDGFTSAEPATPLGVAGGAVLTVKVVAPARVGWARGGDIVSIADLTAGRFRTFRHVVYGGSVETGDCDATPIAQGNHYDGFYCDNTNPRRLLNWLPITKIGLGVRARLPFRVFALAGPGGGSRLVIDVAHRW